MERTITIPFHSGTLEFTATFEIPDSDQDLGYLLDDALKRAGKVTFEQAIPRLNGFLRSYNAPENEGQTTVTAVGSVNVEDITASVTATAVLNRAEIDEDQVKLFLRGTIVKDTLAFLAEEASLQGKDANPLVAILEQLLGGRAHQHADDAFADPFANPFGGPVLR